MFASIDYRSETRKCDLKTEACNKSIESTTENKTYPTSYNLARWENNGSN